MVLGVPIFKNIIGCYVSKFWKQMGTLLILGVPILKNIMVCT